MASAFIASTDIGISPVAGDEDDRDGDLARGQFALEFKAAHARQTNVQDQAGGCGCGASCQETCRVGKRLDAQTHGVKQALDGRSGGGIVIHDEYDGLIVRHD